MVWSGARPRDLAGYSKASYFCHAGTEHSAMPRIWITPPTTSVTVTAGQRYVVVVYGVPSDGFKVVTAPIAAP